MAILSVRLNVPTARPTEQPWNSDIKTEAESLQNIGKIACLSNVLETLGAHYVFYQSRVTSDNVSNHMSNVHVCARVCAFDHLFVCEYIYLLSTRAALTWEPCVTR